MYTYQILCQHYLYSDSLFKEKKSENDICEFPMIYIRQFIFTTATLVLSLLPIFLMRKRITNVFNLTAYCNSYNSLLKIVFILLLDHSPSSLVSYTIHISKLNLNIIISLTFHLIKILHSRSNQLFYIIEFTFFLGFKIF